MPIIRQHNSAPLNNPSDCSADSNPDQYACPFWRFAMDRLQAMQVFTRVVDTNSFTRAAETLDLPRASVTTIIQNLEAFLGTRLMHRTTRRLSLTPDGAAYYERCVRILADVEETEASFQSGNKKPHGKLRIDMPGSIGRLLVIPQQCEFHTRYPDIDLSVRQAELQVDVR